ncbi:hypothetical protein Q664_37660 [Archangium violaceum Cb vi76]|uniref:Uncharacterized protein n=1 Tax=Archangium violaceum Cb vi76 TaxID=1406225 RepID=A0A084SKK9_9BACT|nr:hypothetical protein Q664_37660 [Archangium violaceum Cb vi76]
MTEPLSPLPLGEGRGEGVKDSGPGFPSCWTGRVPGKGMNPWRSGGEEVSGSGRKESPRARVEPASR